MPHSIIEKLYRLHESAVSALRAETPMWDVHRLEPWYGVILEILSKEAAPVPIMMLVAALKRPKSTLTKATDRLEKAGYITKTHSEKDGRFVLVELTPAGRIALDLFAEAQARLEAKMLESISKDQLENCLHTLDMMEYNLQ